jgi:hypothetical protein
MSLLPRLERVESLLKQAIARATAALAAAGGPLAMGGDVTGTTAASVLSKIAALAGGGNRFAAIDDTGTITTMAVPRFKTYHQPQLVNDGIAVVIGTIDVSAPRTFYIFQTYVYRDNIGRLSTVQHRVTVKGDPALPVIQVDSLQNSVSNLTGVPILTQTIVGTDLSLSIANPALAASAIDVTVYNDIYMGLGSPT